MKSTIDWGDSPLTFRCQIIELLEEWEQFTGSFAPFRARVDGKGGTRVSSLHGNFDCTTPQFTFDLRYGLSVFSIFQRGVLGGIALQRNIERWVVRLPRSVSNENPPTFKGVSTVLGVGDVKDIQPHEYGLLKLKYGLGKEHLFIPSVVKGTFL